LKFIFLLLILIPIQSFAWSHHNRLTQVAISGNTMDDIRNQKIVVTDFSNVVKNAAYILQDLKTLKTLKDNKGYLMYEDINDYNPSLSFNENIKINRNYIYQANYSGPSSYFLNLCGAKCQNVERVSYVSAPYIVNSPFEDKVGQTVTAGDILVKYVDEPDWGMDQLLFNSDQYPEIGKVCKNVNDPTTCENKYAKMGAADNKDPVPTQAFRHMYWQWDWDYHYFVQSIRLPMTHGPLGQAPARAGLFAALSKRAFEFTRSAEANPQKLNLDYWGYRFLANALHYLEDVSQPYHSTQTATKKFITMAFPGKDKAESRKTIYDNCGLNILGCAMFSLEVQHVLTYYHFAFEDYIARLLEKYFLNAADAPEAKEFIDTLSIPSIVDDRLAKSKEGIYIQTTNLALYAISQASQAGQSSLEFFPGIPSTYLQFDGNASKIYMDDKYWNSVFQKGQTNSKEKQDYFSVVHTMYSPMGSEVRAAIKAGAPNLN